MRGLIYKDTFIFFRSIDRKLILIAAATLVLLLFNAGNYAGLFASVMLAMTVGMQNIMSFASDEIAGWKKYQSSMPVSCFTAVASKYISVLSTVAFSVLGSLFLNIVSSILSRNLNPLVWGCSIASAVIIPLIWTGICLPITYWFGFRSAQAMGLFIVIPMFYLIKYFEDGPGMAAIASSVSSYLFIAGTAAILIFGFSLLISVLGYRRKN